ncbi:flagellar hook protein FlgE [Falsirhodobacter deserti]|uniref:flagellar hook protein FlgE n=1 Tax=Falsirhodobacter deserti TaxID=1365611 RepID=UPI000FE36EEB|nr:flagellar hook-basal body complex protein [Falsirhodobacter deserti]
MTITSSMNAGVAGLNANASRLASISDNIANAGTYGYKRAETDFYAMVSAGSSGDKYSAGGVRATSTRLVNESGALTGTSNATDLSISGRGFIPVSADGENVSLATTGSFRMDATGTLVTEAGLTLMGWKAGPDGTVTAAARESMAALEPVKVGLNQFISNPTTRMSMSVNLPATATQPGAETKTFRQTMEYFDTTGTSSQLTASFTPVEATGTAASNQWTMELRDEASGEVKGSYLLTFDISATAGGTLSDVQNLSGAEYDEETGSIELDLGESTVAFNIGKYGSISGMTQLSDTYTPGSIEKNGSAIGSLTSVEVDDDGMVRAIYDQGFSRVIYQVPVVDVPNPNGLKSLNNQTYGLTNEAGAFYLWDAGTGPAGTIEGYTREESTTDIARELTSLIQTQHAYSSNAKIIQTVDEMLQETTNLKR